MYRAKRLTPICRIGSTKPTGDEWASYSKKFTVDGTVEYATLELESDGVCGIYLNGEFVEGHMGRLPGRVFYAEITSKLREGENELTVTLCNSYRNLMGPHHGETVEPLSVSPKTFSFEKNWENGRCDTFNEGYSFVRFGIDSASSL